MDVEHVGLAVEDPVAAARWYAQHLGMRVVRSGGPPAHGRFLADGSGHVMLEVYNNPAVAVPDYRAMDPRVLHVAFETDDVEGLRERLLRAGAAAEGEIVYADDGDVIATLRDPWGLPIQLAKRGRAMI